MKTIFKLLFVLLIITSCNSSGNKSHTDDETIINNSENLKEKLIEDFKIFEIASIENNPDKVFEYLSPIMFEYLQSEFPEEDLSTINKRKEVVKQIIGRIQDIKDEAHDFKFEIKNISNELVYEDYYIYKIVYLTQLFENGALINTMEDGKVVALYNSKIDTHWKFVEYQDENIESILSFLFPKNIIDNFISL